MMGQLIVCYGNNNMGSRRGTDRYGSYVGCFEIKYSIQTTSDV